MNKVAAKATQFPFNQRHIRGYETLRPDIDRMGKLLPPVSMTFDAYAACNRLQVGRSILGIFMTDNALVIRKLMRPVHQAVSCQNGPEENKKVYDFTVFHIASPQSRQERRDFPFFICR